MSKSIYYDCKFYVDGKCTHEDAPANNPSCIGKADCDAWKDSLKHQKPQ